VNSTSTSNEHEHGASEATDRSEETRHRTDSDETLPGPHTPGTSCSACSAGQRAGSRCALEQLRRRARAVHTMHRDRGPLART
jgi:hypothetical protein